MHTLASSAVTDQTSCDFDNESCSQPSPSACRSGMQALAFSAGSIPADRIQLSRRPDGSEWRLGWVPSGCSLSKRQACILTDSPEADKLQPTCVVAAMHIVAALQQASVAAKLPVTAGLCLAFARLEAFCCMQVLRAGHNNILYLYNLLRPQLSYLGSRDSPCGVHRAGLTVWGKYECSHHLCHRSWSIGLTGSCRWGLLAGC